MSLLGAPALGVKHRPSAFAFQALASVTDDLKQVTLDRNLYWVGQKEGTIQRLLTLLVWKTSRMTSQSKVLVYLQEVSCSPVIIGSYLLGVKQADFERILNSGPGSFALFKETLGAQGNEVLL